jgi:asparagine synthase (glutamine-hydrolysing)
MCGICGFSWSDQQLLERMKRAIAHRGPDAHGSFVADDVSLGHQRLSIVDLTESGRQPFANSDGTVWVTFNGEIYNHPELKRILEQKGYVYRSTSDTESIVHAYEEYGLDAVKHLTGMFAFAIWDARKRRIVLARDRLGIKPLYYTLDRGKLRFASEIKALLADPTLERSVNPQGLFDLIGYEFTPAPDTLFRGIHKLPPGSILVFETDGQFRISQYWSLQQTEVDASPQGLVDLLGKVCADHMMSDVAVGSFLSGGIDSSAVVQFASRLVDSPLQTFALGYSEKSYSEFEYARRVAEHFHTEHRELLINPIDRAEIERSVWHLDEPTTDPSNLPFMLICEQARRYVKVCLSGDGGDELLMGYDRFRASKVSHLLDLVPLPFRNRLYQVVIDSISDNDQKKGASNMIKRFLQGAVLPRSGEHIRWQYFLDPAQTAAIFKPEYLRAVNTDPFALVKRWSALAPQERGAREQFVDLNTILPDSVLMKVDKMSMAHSLEVRPPFLDHRVVEYCYSLPTNMKLHGFTTKWLLKTAMENRLPPGIAHRKKQGFSIPMKNWIRGDLLEYTHDTVFSSRLVADYFDVSALRRFWQEHQQRRNNHSHLFWTLLNLSIWERLFLSSTQSTIPPRALARASC